MLDQITTLKKHIKSHTAIAFSPRDIQCGHKEIVIGGKYSSPDISHIMEGLGIRENLTKDILKEPEANWGIIQAALSSIDSQKRIGCIVGADGKIATFIKTAPKEPTPVNFDTRLDELIAAIDDNSDLQGVTFDRGLFQVHVHTINHAQISVGDNDDWQFGTTVDIGYSNQQFSNFFLRLVCTNGMTTRERIAYRTMGKRESIGRQYVKFSSNHEFAKNIQPRVDKLRRNRASFHEVESIVSQVPADMRQEIAPWYSDILGTYAKKGHALLEMSSARQKLVYTDQNAYDIFNLATNIASHRREEVGEQSCRALNKFAGEMFAKGPGLEFTILDAYN